MVTRVTFGPDGMPRDRAEPWPTTQAGRRERIAARGERRDQMRARVVEVYLAGNSLMETAAVVGCSYGTVRNLLKEAGQPSRRWTIPSTDQQKDGAQ